MNKKNHNSVTTPQISIIVTTHNNATDLPQCLDALLEQTLKNIEIICVDDASTDDSAKLIREYEKRDPRIIGIINEQNLGVSESRNIGLAHASAPYIMFCDGDDYYDAAMCKKMLAKIQDSKPKVDLVISEIRVIYHAHTEMRISDDYYYSLHFSGYQPISERVITETDFAPTNKLFRKELIDKFNLRFPKNLHYEDAYFCAAYMCMCKAAYYLNEQLYNYVRHPGSIMSTTWSKKDSQDISIEHVYIGFKLYKFLEENNLLKKHNTAFWQLFGGFERFSMNFSKSRQNTQKVREIVRQFIQEHQESFNDTPIEVQNLINQMTSQKFAPSKTRLKQFILKFLPTYRLQIQNVIRMKALRQRHQQLLEAINAKRIEK